MASEDTAPTPAPAPADKSIRIPSWLLGTIVSVLIYGGGMLVSVGYYQAQIQQLEVKVEKSEATVKDLEIRVRATELSIAGYGAKLDGISNQLRDINASIQSLRDKPQ